MKAPSSKKLQERFDITAKEANLIRKFAKAADDPNGLEELVEQVPATEAYVRQMYTSPYGSQMWRDTVALHAIDQILGGYGVEALGGDDDDPRSVPDYEYVNMGDTYATTLIFDSNKDRLFIGSYGDLVESMDENPEAGCGCGPSCGCEPCKIKYKRLKTRLLK